MLDLIWNMGELDVNARRRSRTNFWRFVDLYFQMGIKSGILSKSQFAMNMAHDEGATPLHTAARDGMVEVADWLLQNGAHKSLWVRNAMGCTPLDVARIFGPHPAVEAKLGAAMLNHEFNIAFTVRRGSLLRREASDIADSEVNNDESHHPPEPTLCSSDESRSVEPAMIETTTEPASTLGENLMERENATLRCPVPTTGGGIAQRSAVDLGAALTMLSNNIETQAFRTEARFDEQAARLDRFGARFDALHEKIDALLLKKAEREV